MSLELFEGTFRLAVPLFCIAIAGVWLARTGVINIALDGQIAFCSIAYVIGVSTGYWFIGLVLSFIAAETIGAILIILKEKYKLDELLVGIGLLYFCYGLSQLMSKLVFNNPGYALLGKDNIGEGLSFFIAIVFAIFAIIAEIFTRKVRLSKVIAESQELASLQGIKTNKLRQFHGLVASLLIMIASVYLVEHGGAFTSQVSGQRGFLALAIVAIVNHSGLYAIFWAFGFALGQKLVYTLPLPNELLEAAPYIIAIVLLILRGRKNNFIIKLKLLMNK